MSSLKRRSKQLLPTHVSPTKTILNTYSFLNNATLVFNNNNVLFKRMLKKIFTILEMCSYLNNNNKIIII